MKPVHRTADPDLDRLYENDTYDDLRDSDAQTRLTDLSAQDGASPATPPPSTNGGAGEPDHYGVLLDVVRDTLDRDDVWPGLRWRLYSVVTELRFGLKEQQ